MELSKWHMIGPSSFLERLIRDASLALMIFGAHRTLRGSGVPECIIGIVESLSSGVPETI